MLIPLSDPIWSRLYGPYGVQDVPAVLARLAQNWDTETAENLYWEMLFHQEDLYPVTYAALPWLWHMLGQRESTDLDALQFFSLVLLCAHRREVQHGTPHGKYLGLSRKVEDHAKSWLPSNIRLLPEDMKTLVLLEAWVSHNGDDITTACLEAVPRDDPTTAARLSIGFCGLRGGEGAAKLLEMWGDGYDWETMQEVVTLTAQDTTTLTSLWRRVNGKNPELATFIADYVGGLPPDSHQFNLKLI